MSDDDFLKEQISFYCDKHRNDYFGMCCDELCEPSCKIHQQYKREHHMQLAKQALEQVYTTVQNCPYFNNLIIDMSQYFQTGQIPEIAVYLNRHNLIGDFYQVGLKNRSISSVDNHMIEFAYGKGVYWLFFYLYIVRATPFNYKLMTDDNKTIYLGERDDNRISSKDDHFEGEVQLTGEGPYFKEQIECIGFFQKTMRHSTSVYSPGKIIYKFNTRHQHAYIYYV